MYFGSSDFRPYGYLRGMHHHLGEPIVSIARGLRRVLNGLTHKQESPSSKVGFLLELLLSEHSQDSPSRPVETSGIETNSINPTPNA